MASGYIEGLVSYIDLLGFRDLIEEKGDNAEAVRSILELAREEFSVRRASTSRIKSVGTKRFLPFSFSDLIVRCIVPEAPSRAEELVVNEVIHLGEKQLSLINQHMLIRGGICCGSIFAESPHLFGKGLNKSYALESEYAIFPRVVIDRDLVDNLDDPSLGISSEDRAVKRGDDGVYYVNYLYAGVVDRLEEGLPDEGLAVLNQHANAVEFMLENRILVGKESKRKPTERVKQKYMWLALYHNGIVQRLLEEKRIQPGEAAGIAPEFLRF